MGRARVEGGGWDRGANVLRGSPPRQSSPEGSGVPEGVTGPLPQSILGEWCLPKSNRRRPPKSLGQRCESDSCFGKTAQLSVQDGFFWGAWGEQTKAGAQVGGAHSPSHRGTQGAMVRRGWPWAQVNTSFICSVTEPCRGGSLLASSFLFW